MLEKILQVDREILIYLNNLGNEHWDGFWLSLTNQFNWTPLFVVLLILIYKKFGWKNSLLLLLFISILVAFSDQFTNLIKNMTERVRPCNTKHIVEQLRSFSYKPRGYSFYSGHASLSMTFTIFMILLLKDHFKYIPLKKIIKRNNNKNKKDNYRGFYGCYIRANSYEANLLSDLRKYAYNKKYELDKNAINIKKNFEIFGLVSLIIVAAVATSYFNYKKKEVSETYLKILDNIYLKKTLSHLINNLEPKYKKIKHKIQSGETFDKILENYSIDKEEVIKIKNSLKTKINLNKLNTKQIIQLSLDKTNNTSNEFYYQISSTQKI